MEKDKLKIEILEKEVKKIFKKFGLSNLHALISTKALINAELVGAYGLGLSRLKMYCDRISKKVINPNISEKSELWTARISASIAVVIAGYFGINPPGFVAAVVALAFGLAAASLFPAIVLGIFSKRINSIGAVSGMIVGILFMLFYMMKF